MIKIVLEIDKEEFEDILDGNQKCVILSNSKYDLYDFDLENDYVRIIDKDSTCERSLDCSISHFFDLMECFVASIDVLGSDNV